MRLWKYLFLALFISFILACLSCSSDDDCCLKSTWYIDSDSHGYGNPDTDLAISACEKRDGYVDNNSDCNDTNAAINTDALEVINDGVDNNCDGLELTDNPPTLFEVMYLTLPWYLHQLYGLNLPMNLVETSYMML